MKIKKGIGVSPGVAIAPAVVLDIEEFDIPRRQVPSDMGQVEMRRLRKAVEVSRKELADLRERTAERVGKEVASIFDFHRGLLGDKELMGKFQDAVLQGHATAEYAVATVLRAYAKELQSMPAYLADRTKDIYDVEKRLLRNLLGEKRESLAHLTRDVNVLAHDLTPSQTAGIDRGHVRGLAMDAGGRTSHTAIVARALGIPAVVGLNDLTAEVGGGDVVIIDGDRGVVVVEPDTRTIREYKRFAEQQVELVHELEALRDLPAITLDGHEVTLLGNIEFPDEVGTVLDQGGQGIGLYRTEFLYLGGQKEEPGEDDQYRAYREVIDRCAGRPVVIRTLDLGADKYTQARARTPERNPFLGLRSIRFCLQNLPMFRRQIRAILRAGTAGPLSVMFPLITSILELRQAKSIVRDVAEDLEEEQIEHRADVPMGIMVETPSAALQGDALARESDFFSLGTNDLIQYTLAVDRGNERVATMFTAAHPAVLRLIKDVIRAGQRHGVPVSLCGEMAGDPQFTMLLLGLGLRVFSCTPLSIPRVKQVVRSVTVQDCTRLARKVMGFDSDREVLTCLALELRRALPGSLAD